RGGRYPVPRSAGDLGGDRPLLPGTQGVPDEDGPERPMSRVGFIGLGNMGGPMALNVAKAGHTMVVTDIRREAAKPHLDQGAQWDDSPKALAQARESVST